MDSITRTDLINHLITKHNLKRYLEIGLQNADQNFNHIKAEVKTSVDPAPSANATHCMTSDVFFQLKNNEYDLIFIDGLHTAEQVKKDFQNALKILSPNGFIVLHDCNPLKEHHTLVPRPTPSGHWNGDVYKFAVTIGKNAKVTVDIDNGCMVVKPYSVNVLFATSPEIKSIKWTYFDENRKELLNLTSWDDFTA